MAKTNSTAAPFVLDCPSKHMRVLAISPGASRFDVSTLIEGKLTQLESMLSVAYGEAGESFRNLDDEIQDNYLWAVASMAQEARALYQTLEGSHFKNQSAEEQKAD